jgi:monovalent cation:H+ antiporter-2, CPA2 family
MPVSMDTGGLLVNLGIVLGAALIGGLVSRLLRLPIIVGYLLAGIAVGPYTPGFIADVDAVQEVANLGVILLMFAVGVQFSLRDLKTIRRTAFLGGAIQILGTILLGVGIALLLGWDLYSGLFLGCALSLSSSAVIVKLLEERAELGSAHGGIMMALSVVQDLSLLLMVTLLPALSPTVLGQASVVEELASAALRATVFVGGTVVFASYIIPFLFSRIVRTGSVEIFLLAIVALATTAAVAAEEAGLGLAIGAFVAGVVVSESPYASEIFAQVRPLRDVFASLFFVSIGLLVSPQFVIANWWPVLAVVGALVVGKTLLTLVGVYLAGWHGRTSLIAALGLAQIGEFSFVLAQLGAQADLVPELLVGVILSSALISLLLSPFLFDAARPLYGFLDRMPALHRLFNRRTEEGRLGSPPDEDKPHVVVLGGGRVGRYVSDSLRAKGVPHIVIDFDSVAIARLLENGAPILFGDASSPAVLEMAKPERALLAVVALPEVGLTETAIKHLKRLAPDVPVVARVRRGIDIPRMRSAGADAVVHGEFESGAEMIMQALSRLGFGFDEIHRYLDELRQERYRQEE